jgi:MFS transporter, FSR family, fosmidomycin resistance protein
MSEKITQAQDGPAGRTAPSMLAYANIAHFFSHLFMLIYPTVVLALGDRFDLPYGRLLVLSLPGFILFGAAALPAGWLGDRWSARAMLAIFFLGTGASAVATGFAGSPFAMAFWLGAIGLFASICHPVGTALVVAHAVNPGRSLGFNGVCGSAGIAAAPLIAGAAATALGWRWAFILPGVLSIAAGLVFLVASRDTMGGRRPKQPSLSEYRVDRADALRGLGILMITALSIGIMAQALMVGLPKILEVRVPSIAWAGLLGVSGLVTLALGFSMIGQIVGGRLADRFALKAVYVGTYAALVPAALAAAVLGELPLVAAAALVMMLTATGLPAENTLIARYCPSDWHARVYGVKFVLSLGVAALAVPMVGAIYDATGGFFWLFVAIAGFAALIVACGIFLPRARPSRPPVGAAAE